ncbi:anthrax toxin-like adenylyl cyclase domain-containing protein [Endozoicomonas euniceicola]
MPLLHAAYFQQVADQTDCIISCRSVGKYATGLILEGYACKGFRVKAKTCSWGPMAGFVSADPRFSKRDYNRSAIAEQRMFIRKAMKEGANLIPIYISDSRKRDILTRLRCMYEIEQRSATEIVYAASAIGGPLFKFVLSQDNECPVASEGRTWRVCYHKEVKPEGPRGVQALIQHYENRPDPVLGLTNPGRSASNYKEALTGDYDLWGVYAKVSDYNAAGDDQRIVQGSNYQVLASTKYRIQESKQWGNYTPRVLRIKELLNQAHRAKNSVAADITLHSDELGRPYVDEVELGFISFFPHQSGGAQFISNLGQFQVFISQVRAKNYQDVYNPNWQYFHAFNQILDQLDKNRNLYGQSALYV